MELKGKIINFLGDSITEGAGVTDRKNSRYDNRLLKSCEFAKVNNYGIGGTRLAHQTKPSENPRFDLCFCGRAACMDSSADIVVVYGGVNDYLHGDAPIGKLGDITPATFHGGVYYLMNYLNENYKKKGKTVVFLTPARCFGHEKVTTHHAKRPDAMSLVEYVKIIIKTAEIFDIPVLDMYNKLGLDPNDPEVKSKYTSDGLHFNDEGHAIIAERIEEFLRSL